MVQKLGDLSMKINTLAGLLLSLLLLGSCTGEESREKPKTKWRQKDLLITYSCSAPATKENIDRASKEDFNLIPASQEALDLAEKNGLRVMLEHGRLTPNIADDPEKLNELAQVIAQVKDHPALEAYYLFDEPKASDIPAVAKLVSFIRQHDPKHFSFVNMLPAHAIPGKQGVDPSLTYLSYLRDYIKAVKPDLLSYDYYDFYENAEGQPVDLGFYFFNLELIRKAAQEAGIPFINIIQACKFDNNWRTPSDGELRWQVYTTLAYGGRGISYFLYWGPAKYGGIYQNGKPGKLLEPVEKLNREMKALSHTLMNLQSVSVYNTRSSNNAKHPSLPVQILSPGPFVLGYFSSRKDHVDHFMLVNADYRKSVTARIKVNCKSLSEFDRVKTSWSVLPAKDNGEYHLDFAAGDGRLFHFD